MNWQQDEESSLFMVSLMEIHTMASLQSSAGPTFVEKTKTAKNRQAIVGTSPNKAE